MKQPTDPVMAEINAGIEAHRQGDNATARRVFDELWARIGQDGDPLHRCVLGHFMADAQDDPAEKLRWDERALAAADSLTDERAKSYHASLSVRGFYPSLYLNLAQDHQLLGDLPSARAELAAARVTAHTLAADDYGKFIRAAIDRLGSKLEAA
jgi:hypothetical protein